MDVKRHDRIEADVDFGVPPSRPLPFALLLLCAACSSEPHDPDAGEPIDAAAPIDASAPVDAGFDAGPPPPTCTPTDEVCDGAEDEDCDDSVDEGCACVDGDERACGTDQGTCEAGTQRCEGGAWSSCSGTGPAAEVCDEEVDADCDGLAACADDDCAGAACGGDTPPEPECADGFTLRTYAAAATCGDGACQYAATDTACPERCVAGACVTCTPDPWVTTTVDATGDTGKFPSLEVDADGEVHVAYAGPSVDLRYAHRDGAGAWATELAHPGGSSSPSVAVDAAGNVHVTGHHYMNDGLLLASRDPSGTWTRSRDAANRPIQPTAAVDGTGRLHVVFRATSGALIVALESGGTWALETVPTPTEVNPTLPSAAFDATGALHIAYRDQDARDLRYARRDATGAWTEELVASTEDVYWLSLALDPMGRAHFAFIDHVTEEVRYAHRDSTGAWAIETVADYGGFSSALGIAADRFGGIHIAYYESGGADLGYALRTPSGSWTLRTIDSAGTTGLSPSIGVDEAGRAHIAYWAGTPGDLRHATGVECF